jgi:hypothetical protein
MSELDRLTSGSVSGVAMRRKKVTVAGAPTVAAEVANVLAESQGSLARELANVLTSLKPVAPAPRPEGVSFSFIRNAEGRISAGTATCGDSQWGLSVVYEADGRVRFQVTPQ